VKINKMSGKKTGVYFLPIFFFVFWGGAFSESKEEKT
jgi:hypothetical protein